ncbi:MAG TPA: RluA family pseudouridine synthase [Spirochaetota bacterium]|nr:RluA family pseudouridine synthase [Spirochaetota bacterium]HOM38366.1 RluA family pseudouridine synthase [Spirochaetota bacterium]HPQ48416.1 RluA family pseudouridine synthase [Spirochaetota bacterium]
MTSEKYFSTTVNVENNSKRIDVLLAELIGISRTTVKKFEENILVNGKRVKTSYKIKKGDNIDFKYKEEIECNNINPQDIPIEIVYEDEYILVVNKPYGMVTHPAKGHKENTLLNAVFWKIKEKESDRPGIVHRLDKDTSGLIIVAKTKKAQEILIKNFKKRRINKIYYALVEGHLTTTKGLINLPIGRDKKNRFKFKVTEEGKEAITLYKVIKEYKNASLLAIKIKTGRTHQIRVHLSHIGNPVVGDKIYGKKFKNFDMCLVAKKLGFTHPITEKYIKLSIEIPEHMKRVMLQFKNK